MAHSSPHNSTVAIVTGTRAEFGLLRPVIDAANKHARLQVQLIAAGAHFLPPARTIREVESNYSVSARVPMQSPGKLGRAADAAALGRGVSGFAKTFARLKPDWVVVLGDRIEAFAAASAAAIAGIAICHIHGGDRAEGIADEAMRHAISKLAHLHCAASNQSADRLIRMGERPEHVHVTGSPAIDGLKSIKPMSDRDAAAIGDPAVVVLLHPTGLDDRAELGWAAMSLLMAAQLSRLQPREPALEGVLLLAPNHDPGREVIATVWAEAARAGALTKDHLPRPVLLALLCRLAARGGYLVGNSSAGLIEAAALGVTVINVGPRQSGRERPKHVIHVADTGNHSMARAIGMAVARSFGPAASVAHPYGDGRAGQRIAGLLARINPHDPALLRKHNTY